MSGVSNTYGMDCGKQYSVYRDAAGKAAGRKAGMAGPDRRNSTNGTDSVDGMDKTETCNKDNNIKEWMDIIAERKKEIVEKVRKGETEPSIPIGAASFTSKQWNKLMRNVDRAIEDMQERIRADEEEAEQIIKKQHCQKKKADSITMEMLEELLGIEVKDGRALKGGSIASQAGGGERVALDNDYYCIQPSGNGMFRITDKKTGLEYSFAEKGCSLKYDRASGRTFLIPDGDYAQAGNILVADEELLAAMGQYFGVEKLEAGPLIGYFFGRNEETGIEIMIPPGMKGRMAHMLFQSKEDVEAYESLVQTYRDKYPNLVQSDAMAKFYAALEIEGLCQRTETGILYMNAGSIGYADDGNPGKNWWLDFRETSEENYEAIMEMLSDIRKNGKDIDDLGEWTARMEEKEIAYVIPELEMDLSSSQWIDCH